MLRKIAVIKANFISHPTLDKFIFPSPWCLIYGKCRKWGFSWKCPQSGTKDAMPEEILHLSTYFWLTKVTCMEERLALSYFLSSENFWDGGQGFNIMWAVCTYNSGRKRKWKTTLSLWRRVHKMKNLQGLRSTFCQMTACRCTFWHVCCSEWLYSVLVVDFKKTPTTSPSNCITVLHSKHSKSVQPGVQLHPSTSQPVWSTVKFLHHLQGKLLTGAKTISKLN